jgi:hypothetical protein
LLGHEFRLQLKQQLALRGNESFISFVYCSVLHSDTIRYGFSLLFRYLMQVKENVINVDVDDWFGFCHNAYYLLACAAIANGICYAFSIKFLNRTRFCL